MLQVIISLLGSAILSIIITKKLAIDYFKIIDGHVSDVCETTKKYVDEIKAMVDKHE